MKEFIERLKKAAYNVWQYVKGLPVVKPLWALVYSRKAAISAALITFAIAGIPELAPFKEPLAVFVAQVVTIVFALIAQSLGISIEDSAAKSGTVITTTLPGEGAVATVTSVASAGEVG